jgi:hypothetical protein
LGKKTCGFLLSNVIGSFSLVCTHIHILFHFLHPTTMTKLFWGQMWIYSFFRKCVERKPSWNKQMCPCPLSHFSSFINPCPHQSWMETSQTCINNAKRVDTFVQGRVNLHYQTLLGKWLNTKPPSLLCEVKKDIH